MNGRQAARAAAKKIEEQEFTLLLNKLDIRDYNLCILSMIDGGNPCEYCEDFEECQLQAKGKGCGEWLLRKQKFTEPDVNEEEDDASKGIYGVGQEG